MDPITHTVLAVGSLVGFFLAGEWVGRKKKTDDVLERTVALTIETLERDGFAHILFLIYATYQD